MINEVVATLLTHGTIVSFFASFANKYTLIRQLIQELSNQGILYCKRRKNVTQGYDELILDYSMNGMIPHAYFVIHNNLNVEIKHATGIVFVSTQGTMLILGLCIRK